MMISTAVADQALTAVADTAVADQALTAVADTAVADQAPTASAQPNTATIVLSRRFDVHEVPCFDAEVDRVSAPGTLVIIDASAVRYLDQAGLDALMQARLRCIDRGGDATIADLSVAARVILELTGRYEALTPRLAAA